MTADNQTRVLRMLSDSISIFPERALDSSGAVPSWYQLIMKAEAALPIASNVGTATGRKSRPFDFQTIQKFRDANVHHSRCILTKARAAVGLGFRAEGEKDPEEEQALAVSTPGAAPSSGMSKMDERSKAEEVLDPLCEVSLADVMNDVAEDYFDVGNAYLEVVRDKGGQILGLHHIPANTVHIHIENALKQRHYEVTPVGAQMVLFAKFGDYESFKTRNKIKEPDEQTTHSEVIHIRQPSSRTKWYGFPDWLSCVAYVELQQMMVQFLFDFFNNRGCPDLLLTVLGAKVSESDWKALREALSSTVGRGNQHKTSQLNIPDENAKVQIDKFSHDGGQDAEMFASVSDQNGMMIVSAHGVPPLLAGIQIPGKLGSTNELPNALMAFQALVIQQAQKVISSALINTLGNATLNGGLGLGADNFRLRKITDVISLSKMDTVSRMRQTVPEAKSEGRDLEAGLKKALAEGDDEAVAQITAKAVSIVIDRLLGSRAA